MADDFISSQRQELIERQVAEKVEQKVREQLFRYYRAIWGTATAVLSAFGIGVVVWVYQNAEDFATNAVKPQVEHAEATLKEAQEKLNEASIQIIRMGAQLDAVDDFLIRREDTMAVNDQRLRDSQTRITTLSKEVEQKLTDLLKQISDNTAQLNAIEARAQESARLGNIEDLRNKLDVVAAQVLHLNEGFQILGGAGGVIPSTSSVDTVALEAIVAPTDQRADPSAPVADTVFFQFAGVSRDTVQRISGLLAAKGYDMPGEERSPVAQGLHEVRYFFAEDARKAEQLAQDVNRILAAEGYIAEVTAENFTSFPGKKPRGGILELWLEPVRHEQVN